MHTFFFSWGCRIFVWDMIEMYGSLCLTRNKKGNYNTFHTTILTFFSCNCEFLLILTFFLRKILTFFSLFISLYLLTFYEYWERQSYHMAMYWQLLLYYDCQVWCSTVSIHVHSYWQVIRVIPVQCHDQKKENYIMTSI